jgi:hypothetical protein
MTRTTPWSFYELFVLPNLGDFLDDRTSIRKAVNAAVSAFQLADIMYKFYERNGPAKNLRVVKTSRFFEVSQRKGAIISHHSQCGDRLQAPLYEQGFL